MQSYTNQHTPGQPTHGRQQQQPRVNGPCKGCGKSCNPRSTCPAYNVQCGFCGVWRHTEDVCFKKLNAQRAPNACMLTPNMPYQQSY